jgi:pimeloyl-ACP methyl ester carboxylesterase
MNKLQSIVSTAAASRHLQKIFETPQPMRAKPDQMKTLQEGELTWLPYSKEGRLPLYSFGEGPTVLLVHGLSGRGSQLAEFVVPLTEAGYRAVICDLPAHGDADGKRISFPEIAKSIELIGNHLGSLHAIIAHSNGCATTSFALSNSLVADTLVFISPPEDLKAYLYGLGKYLGFNRSTIQHAEKTLARKYGLPFEAVRGSNIVKHFHQDALIFHDEKDPLVPIEQGLLIAKHWKSSRFVKTRGLGHNKIMKDPDVIKTAIAFITHKS